jgi:hypothetical protein
LIFIFSPVKYFYRYLATGCLLGKEVKLIKDEDSEHLGKRGLGDTGEACCSAHADGLPPRGSWDLSGCTAAGQLATLTVRNTNSSGRTPFPRGK